jgi:hypothetical protein
MEALLRERDRRLLLWLRERERYRLDHRRLEMEGEDRRAKER